MNKLISVIMPVYNIRTSYLAMAIDSILNQTYRNTELIVVDSSDKNKISGLISERNDIRIRYYFREKNGISDALNYGLEMAKGEYIARMDADDISLPQRLEKQVAFLDKFLDVDVVGSYSDKIDCNNTIIERKSILQAEDYEAIKSNMIFDNPIGHPTVMFRRKVIDAGWRYRSVYAEDHDLWTRMLPTVKFANVGEKLLHYRQYEGSTSFQFSRRSMAVSVAEAVRNYVNTLFYIDTDQYKSEDFAKNYSLYFFYDEIEKDMTGYIMRQFSLLYQIYQKNEERHIIKSQSLISVLNKRWQIIMDLSDCILPELSEIYTSLKYKRPQNVFFINYLLQICNCGTLGFNMLQKILRKLFYENELMLKEQFSDKKKFLIYGMGEQGRVILEKCEQLAKDNKFMWSLEGIVDRRKLEVTFLGRTYSSLSKEQIKNTEYDYILVSSTWYFEDIMKELIELGVKERSVIRGGGLYLIE